MHKVYLKSQRGRKNIILTRKTKSATYTNTSKIKFKPFWVDKKKKIGWKSKEQWFETIEKIKDSNRKINKMSIQDKNIIEMFVIQYI